MPGFVRTENPAVEPVTLDQAKAQCRIDLADTSEDALLELYIQAAREACEDYCGRAFITQTWKAVYPRFSKGHSGAVTHPSVCRRVFFGEPLLLPRPRLQSVTSLTYRPASGERQELEVETLVVTAETEPAEIRPANNGWWPYGTDVVVEFTTGYGDAATDVPAKVRLAILLLVGHFYENREATVLPESGTGVVEIPLGIADLLEGEVFQPISLES